MKIPLFKEPLTQKVYHFLKNNLKPNAPVLLALSGGPDSMALLALLLACKNKCDLKIGVAHIDHGWREESTVEAQFLQETANTLQLPFHHKRLDPHLMEGNLEEKCRMERLAFYKELCSRHGYQAVFLGHQRDDQVETIFKSLMEGNSLAQCGGMEAIKEVAGVVLWRPLLACAKGELEELNKKYDIPSFHDKTNHDTSYLRSRLRKELFPEINKRYGKDAYKNLSRFGQESHELKQFLDLHLSPWMGCFHSGVFGSILDLREKMPATRFELKALFRACFKGASAEIIEKAVYFLASKAANIQFEAGKTVWFIDRGVVFSYSKGEEPNWRLSAEGSQFTPPTDWKKGWMEGKASVCLPAGPSYHLLKPSNSDYQALKKIWNNFKVPAFLRTLFPLVGTNGEIVHEFLTGKSIKERQVPYIKLTIETESHI